MKTDSDSGAFFYLQNLTINKSKPGTRVKYNVLVDYGTIINKTYLDDLIEFSGFSIKINHLENE
jgi:hypothetical protein